MAVFHIHFSLSFVSYEIMVYVEATESLKAGRKLNLNTGDMQKYASSLNLNIASIVLHSRADEWANAVPSPL